MSTARDGRRLSKELVKHLRHGRPEYHDDEGWVSTETIFGRDRKVRMPWSVTPACVVAAVAQPCWARRCWVVPWAAVAAEALVVAVLAEVAAASAAAGPPVAGSSTRDSQRAEPPNLTMRIIES